MIGSNYRDLTRHGPPNGDLVRENSYFRVSPRLVKYIEILFHLARMMYGHHKITIQLQVGKYCFFGCL